MEIKEENLKDTQQEKQEKQTETTNQFAPYANLSEEQLKNNNSFLQTANKVVNAALSNLPTAKFLQQEFTQGATNSLYSETINKLFGDFQEVPNGKGIEYELSNGMTVSELDINKFVPDSRNDVDKYSYWTSIELNPEIHQIELMAAPWKYINYFLSGKVDQYINISLEKAKETLALKQEYDAFSLLKTIFSKVYNQASSTKETPTAHLVGTKPYIIDAVKEMKDFIFTMYNHNRQFAINKDFQGYNNLMIGDERFICEVETYNNIKKVATTFLSKEEFLNFTNIDKWVIVPKQICNPSTKIIEDLNIFTDSTGNRVKGAIMILGKSGLKRLMNLKNAFSEYYPKNQTTVHWFATRYTHGILDWTQVAVYNNEALEQDFYLPTEQKSINA